MKIRFFFVSLLILTTFNNSSFPHSSVMTRHLQTTATRSSPDDDLVKAQTVFIRTKSAYFKPAALETELLNRDEIQAWGLVFSRDEADADLIIEVDRKLFTNRFVYSVIDPRANRVLMGGKIGSLGGSVEAQIATSFVNRLKRVRPLIASKQVK